MSEIGIYRQLSASVLIAECAEHAIGIEEMK
jgi:hypothetical protein